MVNELEDRIAAFESAQEKGQADLGDFLPEPGHPLYRAVLAELIRIDLEYGWQHGRPTPLQDYLQEFPGLAEDSEFCPQIAFEEYRLRRQAGEKISPEEYGNRFGIEVDSWPTIGSNEYMGHHGDGLGNLREFGSFPGRRFRSSHLRLGDGRLAPVDTYVLSVESLEKAAHSFAAYQKNRRSGERDPGDNPGEENPEHAELFRSLHRSEPAAADRLARALVSMPEIGSDFLNFRLVGELGRGAFGRVYLAEQRDLAGRHVALKISTDLFCESQTLAQLQHTNIVPIYSAHNADPFQALCMPFLGSTTLADLLKAFQQRHSLPVSGKDLVSTLHERKHSTLPGVQSRASEGKTASELRPIGSQPGFCLGNRVFSAKSGTRNNPVSKAETGLSVAAPGAWDDSQIAPSPPYPNSPSDLSGGQAGWKKLEDMSYVQAVLWIGSRLADGLDCAHEHQIIHRDLKPANVLLADDGQPLLLDFNLSDNLRLRSSVLGASVGGTLPYMAPEQLECFYNPSRPVDARSDLYSLGLILYELVCGKSAFPFPQTLSPPTRALGPVARRAKTRGALSSAMSWKASQGAKEKSVSLPLSASPPTSLCFRGRGKGEGPLWELLSVMIAERKKSPPSMRQWNKAVSPAVESIIRHCLESDPDRRYQSARELQEDLERQLSHRPLRYAPDPSPGERMQKWARRHPRLTSSTSVAFMALGFIAILTTSLVVRSNRLNQFEAKDKFNQFESEMRQAQSLLYGRSYDAEKLDQGIHHSRTALDQYQVLNNPDWRQLPQVRNLEEKDRRQLQENIGETLFLAARAMLLKSEMGNLKSESADWAQGRQEDLLLALDLSRSASRCYEEDRTPRALWQQQGELLKLQGHTDEAEILFQKAEKTPLRTAQDCYLAGHLLALKGNYGKARPFFEEAVQKDPRNFSAWFLRGSCYDASLDHYEASASYSVCIALRPDFPSGWYNRGIANLRGGYFSGAVADFDQTIALLRDPGLDLEASEVYLNRALAQQELKHYPEAIADLDKALELGTPRTQIYFYRAAVREKAKDLEGARRDRDMGMRLKPTDEQSWVARGLARMDQDPKGAVADFDEALKLNPQSFPALQNKAHVLADLLKDDREAVLVLDTILAKYPENPMARAGRGVSLARLGQREKALADGEDALLVDTRPPNLYQVACIYALTSRQNSQDRLRAFELLCFGLKGGFGLDIVDSDSDLDPIRQSPEFRRIVNAARELQDRTAR